jgi:type II secretory pathway pseudopilin PulG
MRAGNTSHTLRSRAQTQSGFAYIAVLAMLLLVALGTQSVVTYASQQAQREREEALLHIGAAYTRAIGAYYTASPGSIKRWPKSLEELLEDKRLVYVQRHLRELYPDPITKQFDWELVLAADGGIQGIRSRSTATPLRTGSVELNDIALPPAKSYSDWSFVFSPELSGLGNAQKAKSL